jgi:tetratricopeptide (TPR) repeat protein
MNHRVESCPDLETIAAFIDGRLEARQRERIAAHVAGCESCYFLVAEAAHVRPASGEEAVVHRPWWQRPVAKWVGTGLAAAAALMLAVRVGFWSPSNDVALDELVAAVGTERLIEPRLTGGFAYGPLRGTTIRSGQAVVAVASPDVRIAAARIEKATTSQYTAAAFRARGVAALVTGDLERAVTALEAALSERATDARVFNDLAAGYLVQGQRTGDKAQISKALTTLNRALEIDRHLAEAHFNRAIALEELSLTSEARDAWQGYLAIDDQSAWAEEARGRLRQLSSQP